MCLNISTAFNTDLRKRILFTLLVFAIFRIMTFITVPLVDKDLLAELLKDNQMNFRSLMR